jgi:hypothetical protein
MLCFSALAVRDVPWRVPQRVKSCVERAITGTQWTDCRAAIGTEPRVFSDPEKNRHIFSVFYHLGLEHVRGFNGNEYTSSS